MDCCLDVEVVYVSKERIRAEVTYLDGQIPVVLPWEKKRGDKEPEMGTKFTRAEKPGPLYVPDDCIKQAREQAFAIIQEREERFWQEQDAEDQPRLFD